MVIQLAVVNASNDEMVINLTRMRFMCTDSFEHKYAQVYTWSKGGGMGGQKG